MAVIFFPVRSPDYNPRAGKYGKDDIPYSLQGQTKAMDVRCQSQEQKKNSAKFCHRMFADVDVCPWELHPGQMYVRG